MDSDYHVFFPHKGRTLMMTQESISGKLQSLADSAQQLSDFVLQSVEKGDPIHEVERGIWQRILKMGQLALGQFLQQQGTGDLGETCTAPDGRTWKRLEGLHRRRYRSIFGVFEIRRAVYGTREGQKIEHVPLDERLQLPEGEFSYVLQDWGQSLSVEHAFSRVVQTLVKILGLRVSVDSLERMNRQMAQWIDEFRAEQPVPKVEEEGEILVATADNKGVPMVRPGDQTPAGRPRRKGEKANKKQMATLGAVYSVDPKSRTAEQVVAALFREPRPREETSESEPVAEQKRIRASLSYQDPSGWINGEDWVFQWMEEEVSTRRDAGQPLVNLMDGQESLWRARRRHLPQDGDVVDILDLLHVTPRLWQAAYLFHAEGSDEATAFVRHRVLEILRGKAGYVIGGLRQMGTKRKLRGPRRRKLQGICNFLQKNLARMRYDQYLAAGYPIASGVIEGACRHVVKDRMERAGMRWVIAGRRPCWTCGRPTSTANGMPTRPTVSNENVSDSIRIVGQRMLHLLCSPCSGGSVTPNRLPASRC